jgi:HD-like signal output (HDOD) protein
MLMGLLQKIRRHAAVASGNFEAMFSGVDIPPLPLAVQRLISEINKEHPDIDELTKMISSAASIAANVIKTANSSYYSPRTPVTEIRQAVMFLGLKNIRSMTTAYAVMDALPKPRANVFDHEAFWIDSLLRAVLARGFASNTMKDRSAEVFTVSLISDIAIPVLLSVWSEYYSPVVVEWQNSPKRLSQIEREHFGWDHAQAGAWMVQSWGFPDELICCIGSHNLTLAEIEKLGLTNTIVAPMAIAALSSSVLKANTERNKATYQEAFRVMGISREEYTATLSAVKKELNETLSLFKLSDRGAFYILDQLASFGQTESQVCCP